MANDHKKNHSAEAEHGRLDDMRGKAADAAHRAAQGVEANPLGVLVGGLAVGALAGALIPRSAREKELLAPLGAQIGIRARTAIDAARSAGMEELNNRGLTRDGVRDQAKGLMDGVVQALSTAGTAAAKSAKKG